MSERTRITFEPDADVETMMDRALRQPSGNKPWGATSFMVNEALRAFLRGKGFARKRELAQKNFAKS